MNFTRIENLASGARNSERVLRRATATTCSEEASPGRTAWSQELRNCQTSLGDHRGIRLGTAYPKAVERVKDVVVRDSLPKTMIGKLSRKDLLAEVMGG